MGVYSSVVRFFLEGGFFMYPIMAVLAVGTAVAIERYIYLSIARATNRRLWDDVVPALRSGKYQQAMTITAGSKAAIATILSYGLARIKSARRREDIEMAMEEGLME